VRAVPMCRVPVGLGARRTRTADPAALANFTQTFSNSVKGAPIYERLGLNKRD